MKTQPLGTSSLLSTRLAYGCWRLAGTWEPSQVTPDREAAGRKAVLAACEAGYTLFDHADIYCAGHCERIFGQALRETRGLRDRILIATKCGIRFAGEPESHSPQRYDFSAEHILHSCDQSLKRLNTDTIDLYQLHRPDFLMNPEEVAAAFDKLKKQGKVREFGVSNFTPSQLTALQSACPMPLIVNQVQIHLADLHCLNDGALDQCLAHKITPLSWSPLAGGLLGTGSRVPDHHPRRQGMVALQQLMDMMAAHYHTTRTLIALAWLLKHPARIIPIVGSTNPTRIAEATHADAMELTREDWYRLLVAARMEPLP
jgi:predicted oxidoreductase